MRRQKPANPAGAARKMTSVASFKTAMLEQLDSVYGLAYAMTQCADTAEELSFLSYRNSLDEVTAEDTLPSSPRKLLFRSLYQILCRQQPQSSGEHVLTGNREETPEPAPGAHSSEFDWESLGQGFKPAFKSLPDKLRLVLYLWAVENISLSEIAEVLGLPAAEIRNQLSVARDRLCARFTSESSVHRVPVQA